MTSKFSKKLYIVFIFISVIIIPGCKEDLVEPSTFAEYTQIDFEPAWSPDGRRIAYSHSNPDIEASGIYLIDSKGDNKIHLVSGFARSADWSSDGNWIVFSQGDQIFKITESGDILTQLTFAGRNLFPKWSSNGQWIAYNNIACDSQCGIWIMKPDGSDKQLIDLNGNYPDWAEGGSLIYFKISTNPDATFSGDSLFQYSLSTKTKRLITVIKEEEHKFNFYPNYSFDKIIFSSTSSKGFSHIYSMNLNGTNIIKLANMQGWSPNLSYDSQSIVYTNRNPGNGRLWIMNTDGRNQKQLTF